MRRRRRKPKPKNGATFVGRVLASIDPKWVAMIIMAAIGGAGIADTRGVAVQMRDSVGVVVGKSQGDRALLEARALVLQQQLDSLKTEMKKRPAPVVRRGILGRVTSAIASPFRGGSE